MKKVREAEVLKFWYESNVKTARLGKPLSETQKVCGMRLTLEQRLQALEREAVVLHDTIKLLHKMLKDQGELISEYIVQKVGQSDTADKHTGGNTRPEMELYTFVCKQRFNRMDRNIEKMRKLIDNLRFGLRAG